MRTESESTHSIPLPPDWKLPESWHKQALDLRKEWTDKHVRETAKRFHAYYTSHNGTRENMQQWELAWRKWARNQRTDLLFMASKTAKKEPESRNCPSCGKPGMLSHNTMSGPYYCRDHFSYR